MSQLFFDIRIGLRLMLRSPGFSLAVVLILALGIGASTAMFSIVHCVLLRALPYPDPDRITVIENRSPSSVFMAVAVQDFLEWKAQGDSFEHMAAVKYRNLALTSDGQTPEYIGGTAVTTEFFSVMGVSAARGRVLGGGDDQPGRDHVVVVTDALWKRRFGSDPDLIGRTLSLDSELYTVVGILGPGFSFAGPSASKCDLWIPLAMSPTENRGSHYLDALGRLRDGVTLDQAEAELNTVALRLEAAYPETNTGVRMRVRLLHDELIREIRPSILLLFAATCIVLLIVCANVANLLLSRAVSRQGEMAMRHALGATRHRLVRQLLVETLLLFLCGGSAGAVLALWAIDFFANGLVSSGANSIAVDVNARALLFSLGASLLTGVVFGLPPAWAASRADVQSVLKEGAARGSDGLGRRRLRNLFVVIEVALAFVLLVGAGLTLKNFIRLYQTHVGFNTHNAVTAQLALPAARYSKDEDIQRLIRGLLQRFRSLPTVSSVAVSSSLPLNGSHNYGDFTIEGRAPWRVGEEPSINKSGVSAGYFRTMGIPVLAGREFDERDTAESRPVIIINERTARRFFPNEDPIGKRISRGERRGLIWREVVGIVGDLTVSDREVDLDCYVPIEQWLGQRLGIVVRTEQPETLLRSLPEQVRAVDPVQPAFRVMTYEQLVSDSISQQRFHMILFSGFALTALVIAAIGLFSVVSYSTSQRTREIGIRVALGAPPAQVLRLVMRQAGALVLLGLLLGVGGSLGVGRVMASMITGAISSDPATLVGSAALLGVTGFIACLIPAWRATRISPAAALRYE